MNFLARSRERIAAGLIFLGIIGFISLAATSVRDDGLTIDETAHIVSGYAALRYGSFDINLEHPPLIKIVAALPLIFTDTSYTRSLQPAPNQWDEGNRFLFSQTRQVDTILWRSRLSVITFNALLLCSLAYLSWRVFEEKIIAGVLILLLCLDPNLIAHGHYVTTDAPIALAIIGLVLSLMGRTRQVLEHSLVWIVIFLSLVLLVKFSGLLAFILGIACLAWMGCQGSNSFRALSIAILLPLFCTYLVYLPLGVHVIPSSLDKIAREAHITSPFLREANDHLFLRPISTFAIGALGATARSKLQGTETFPQFLDREGRENKGWWDYFFRATLYKETPTFLLIILSSLLLFVTEQAHRKHILKSITIPLIILSAYLIGSITSDLNIGIRHFLPVLALSLLCSLLLFDDVVGRIATGGKHLLATACATLLILQCYSVGSVFPYYLSYFNAISGGWQHGYTHLVDSNLDWGEQLKRLSLWTYAQGVRGIKVDYWGKTPLNTYDPEGRLVKWSIDQGQPTGYFAINPMWIVHSAWAHAAGKTAQDYAYLERLAPIKTFGGGLWVYDLGNPGDRN